MNARDYYLDLQDVIHAAPFVLRSDLRFEEEVLDAILPIILLPASDG